MPAEKPVGSAAVATNRHLRITRPVPHPDPPASRAPARTESGPQVPVVALPETPPAVRAAIVAEANGRPLEKINRVPQLEGPLFRAYISSEAGPQLLTVNERGQVIDNAVVVRFEDLPPVVQASAKTGVTGKVQTCRKSIHRPNLTYVIDYLLGDDEPAYALIEANGFVRGLYGYAEDDPD